MSENPLWRYSITVYAQPGVEPLLLQLQDQSGADINLLLTCCWLATQQQVLSDSLLNRALSETDSWQQQCVQPLRQLRRYLKSQPEQQAFREKIKALELEAEQWQQQKLWSLLAEPEEGLSALAFKELALTNLQRYCQRLTGAKRDDWAPVLAELVERVAET